MIKLGYWNIRGLAQPVRYLLQYTGSSWEDVLFVQGGPTDPIPYDKSCWFTVKPSLGLDFPNLPFMVDESNGIRLTQSQAIIRYVARLHPHLNLLGSDIQSQSKVDLVLAEFADCKGRMTGLQYSAGVSDAAVEFLVGEDYSSLKPTLGRFSSFLGERNWFAGDYITVADFVMYEYLACASLYHNAYLRSVNLPVVVIDPANNQSEPQANGLGLQPLISEFPNLQAFKVRFEALPEIAGYLTSDKFDAVRAMNNQHAKFR